VRADEFVDDGQAHAGPAGSGSPAPVEAVEDVREIRRFDPGPSSMTRSRAMPST
jgi:hypothetical protein